MKSKFTEFIVNSAGLKPFHVDANRRRLLGLWGGLTATAYANKILGSAMGATWQKLGGQPVPAGTWDRIAATVTTRYPTVQIAEGWDFKSCIRSDGSVYSCGANLVGSLGIGSQLNRSTFGPTTGISNAKMVACGSAFSVVLRSDGLIFSSGGNADGVLGNDEFFFNRSTFVQAVGISQIRAISAGTYHAAALGSDGSVYGVGYNSSGQLGDGSESKRSTYIKAIGISNAIAIACGAAHSLALRSDGLVFAAGRNTEGQLGDHSTAASRNTFALVGDLSNAIALACGGTFSLFLRSDGIVYACGENIYGQLGDNSTLNRSSIVQVAGLTNVQSIAAGYSTSIAIQANGTANFWGRNDYGQIGNLSVTDSSSFIPATGISQVVAACSGRGSSTILTAGGHLYTTGKNSGGNLGIGTTVDRSEFILVK